MATYARVLLSGTTNGKPLPVAATATPGTLVHTAQAGTTGFDEVYLWVANVTAAAATLTIEYGGVTDPGDHACKAVSIPANSAPILILAGLVLNNALVVRAFSGTASALNVMGYVNRIA